MKKVLMFLALILVAVLTFGQQTTDSTLVVTHNLGESIKDFLLANMWTLGFGILYYLSEWIGENENIPEGSLWRKLLNIVLAFFKKKATQSPKMKKVEKLLSSSLESNPKVVKKPRVKKEGGENIVKIMIVAVLLSALSLNMSAQKKERPLRWYPFENKELRANDLPIYTKDSTMYFAPAVSFDVYTRGTTTGKHSVGAIPGIGYNFIYNPFLWEKNYLAGIGVFAAAQQDNDNPDIFTFEITPVVSLLNWIKIGYGHQWNFGGQNEWVLRIGIVKSL